MTTAVFSNGHRDIYKGTRPVMAGWAIIRNSDNVTLNSGHSIDQVAARKTAEGNIRYAVSDLLGRRPAGISDHPMGSYPGRTRYFNNLAKELGFDNWKAAHKAYQADLDLARGLARIEVVAL